MPTINENILAGAEAALENVPLLVTGQPTAQSIFNRYQLTLQAFGMQKVRTLLYKPGTQLQNKTEKSNYTTKPIADLDYSMTTAQTGKPITSVLGTPVFSDIVIKSQDESEQLQMLWVLAEVNQTKQIVKTAIQGRDGKVKEYISDDDYTVTLRGVFSSTFSKAFPKEQVQQLLRICKLKESVKVVSEYLSLFGISELVIEEYSMAQLEGKQNSQKFQLRCCSDTPIELRKKQNV